MVFNFSKVVILDELKGIKLALTTLSECKNNTDDITDNFCDELVLLNEMGEHILKLIFKPISKYIDDNRVESIGLSLEEYDKINEFHHRTMKLLINI